MTVHRRSAGGRLHPYLASKWPIALAHRGGAMDWPENTLEAFNSAYEIGFRYLETDVHLTSDGVIVAFHDPQLHRVSSHSGRIADKSWEQLAAVRVNRTGRIPSLLQLLQRFPDACFNIDMKSDEVVEPLVELVRQQRAFDRVCFASFFSRRIRRARLLAGGDICASAGRGGVVAHVLGSFGVPIPASDAQILQVPLRRYGVQVLSERLIHAAHAHGKVVQVWTIDEPAEMHRLLDWGVDGLMTDRPLVLKQVFVERGIWPD